MERNYGWIPTDLSTFTRLRRENVIQLSQDHAILQGRRALAEWQEIDCRHFFIIENQGTTSMCVGGSGAMTLGGTYRKEGFNLRFCPAAAYAPICGGRDQGASMGDCLEALTKYGCWPEGYGAIGQFDWKSAYRTSFWNRSGAAQDEAAKYRITESIFCDNLADWLSGIQSGSWCGQFGIGAGRAFDSDLDEGGFLRKFDGTGINHAQTATGGMKRNPKTNAWCIQGANPWGTDWGDGGFYYLDPYDWIDPATHRGQELWLVRATTLPPTTAV